MASAAPPFLPSPRPRRLTVSARDNTPEESCRLLSNYGAFENLPVELRRHILTYALGRRTLHIDLALAPVLLTAHRTPSRWKRLVRRLTRDMLAHDDDAAQQQHTTASTTTTTTTTTCHRRRARPRRPVTNKTQLKTWQWHGSVCHRRARFSQAEVMAWVSVFVWPGTEVTPDWDGCCAGLYCECEQWAEDRRGRECPPGVLGWLLSCQQAYAEGIDVVYGSNTFHIASRPLVQAFPRLILPQRLAAIRSLELLWTLKTPRAPAVDDVELHRLCETLPALFPRLQRLHLGLHGAVKKQPPSEGGGRDAVDDDPILAAERALLRPVEAMLRRWDARGAFSVSVAPGFLEVLLRRHDQLRSPGLRAEVDGMGNASRFWKQLPPGDGDGSRAARGYWLCTGMDDGIMDPAPGQDRLRYWGLWRDDPDPARRGVSPISCPVVVSGEQFVFEM